MNRDLFALVFVTLDMNIIHPIPWRPHLTSMLEAETVVVLVDVEVVVEVRVLVVVVVEVDLVRKLDAFESNAES